MNKDERKKKWDELISKMMKSEKQFSMYGLTDSLQSHYTRFHFYQFINEYPDIQPEQRKELSSKFLAYIIRIDEVIERSVNNSEKSRFGMKVLFDMYCHVLQKDMLRNIAKFIKVGKPETEQIITDFANSYFDFLHKGRFELEDDRNSILEIFQKLANIETPMEKLIKMDLLVSKSLLGQSPSLDSIQIKELIHNTIQSKKDLESLPITPIIKNPPSKKIVTKPTFDFQTANKIFEILKGYFDDTQHSDLEKLIKTGNEITQKLVFKDKANRLTDTFKQLIEKKLLTGCSKMDLETWLIDNFCNLINGVVHDLKPQTTHKHISGKNYPCKNPIIEIKNGQVHIASQ